MATAAAVASSRTRHSAVDGDRLVRFGELAGTGHLDVNGWDHLMLAASKSKRVIKAVEAAGMVLHRSTTHPRAVIAQRRGMPRPVW